MRPVTINPRNTAAALTEIAAASRENDVVDIAQNFSFDTEPAQTTALLVGSPTLANTNAVLATVLQIMQKGGINRAT
jgi:hypothetical protein